MSESSLKINDDISSELNYSIDLCLLGILGKMKKSGTYFHKIPLMDDCAIQKGVVVGAALWTENRISHTKLYFSFLSYKILQKQNPQKIAVKYISRTGD